MLRALAQQSRLRIVSLVAAAGAKGVAAGEIARALRCPASTLSFHLKDLNRAGVLEARTRGRFVIYAVQPGVLEELAKFIAGLGIAAAPPPARARAARRRPAAQKGARADRSQLSIFGD
ncbi:MAG: metalloregulator ArsR/SmtB family transcription factor [Gammaproteobacteria bacterium]|nr:metalloregulator ArsR/SmtB family transcription factor [Gammaproteobacteria bacterium]